MQTGSPGGGGSSTGSFFDKYKLDIIDALVAFIPGFSTFFDIYVVYKVISDIGFIAATPVYIELMLSAMASLAMMVPFVGWVIGYPLNLFVSIFPSYYLSYKFHDWMSSASTPAPTTPLGAPAPYMARGTGINIGKVFLVFAIILLIATAGLYFTGIIGSTLLNILIGLVALLFAVYISTSVQSFAVFLIIEIILIGTAIGLFAGGIIGSTLLVLLIGLALFLFAGYINLNVWPFWTLYKRYIIILGLFVLMIGGSYAFMMYYLGAGTRMALETETGILGEAQQGFFARIGIAWKKYNPITMISKWWQVSMAKVRGEYYEGKVDKYSSQNLGVFLEDVKALDKQFYVGDDELVKEPILVSATIRSSSLEVEDCSEYLAMAEILFTPEELIEMLAGKKFQITQCADPDDSISDVINRCKEAKTIIVNCSVEGKRISGQAKPPIIDMTQIEGSSEGIDCELPTEAFRNQMKKDETSRVETINVQATFPFETRAYLKTYFMNQDRKREYKRAGTDILQEYHITDKNPTAIFTGGPIKIGVGLEQDLPIGLDTARPTRLGITIDKNWIQGKIKKLNEVRIIIPQELNLECATFSKSDKKPTDPSLANMEVYTLNEAYIKRARDVEDILTYNCRLKPDSDKAIVQLLRNTPLAISSIIVEADYIYELEESVPVTIKRGDGFEGIITEKEGCAAPCRDYDGCFCDLDCSKFQVYLNKVNRGYNCKGESAPITETPTS